jgi:hypothetical protein
VEIPDGKDSKVTGLGLADGEISTASDGLYFGTILPGHAEIAIT